MLFEYLRVHICIILIIRNTNTYNLWWYYNKISKFSESMAIKIT